MTATVSRNSTPKPTNMRCAALIAYRAVLTVARSAVSVIVLGAALRCVRGVLKTTGPI